MVGCPGFVYLTFRHRSRYTKGFVAYVDCCLLIDDMSCPSTPTFSPFSLLSDVSTAVSNNPVDLSADVVPRSESERISVVNEVWSFLGSSGKLPHPRKTYWKSVRLISEPLATKEHTVGKNKQWYVQCKGCIREYNKGLTVDFSKTVKSDPKTLDRHLISCE